MAQAQQNLAVSIAASGARVTADPLPVVLGSEIQLVRLFQNLISNAVKYRGEQAVEIHVNAKRQGPDWVITIADNGVGIAPENQARVFLPFLRLVNRDVDGTASVWRSARSSLKGGRNDLDRIRSRSGIGFLFHGRGGALITRAAFS